MTQTDIIELFKSMIDRDPLCGSFSCFWCESYRVECEPGPHTNLSVRRWKLHEPDCQWIRAMDLLGLQHPGHEVQQ